MNAMRAAEATSTAPTASASVPDATISRLLRLASTIAPAKGESTTVTSPPPVSAKPTSRAVPVVGSKVRGKKWADTGLNVRKEKVEPPKRAKALLRAGTFRLSLRRHAD